MSDIADTVPAYRDRMTAEMPLGFVSLDVDYCSSSVSGLRIFDHASQDRYLPAVPLWVDDSYVDIMQHDFAGEALAIHMKNLPEMRKIEAGRLEEVRCRIVRKAVRPKGPMAAWNHQVYFAHFCQHPLRSKPSDRKLNKIFMSDF
jgi:hypothetical protein